MSHADIVIVGGGAAGLATAYHLAAHPDAGRVVLIERNPLLAAESSAHNAAILRTLDEDVLQTRIAVRSAAFLRDPPPGFSDVPLVDGRGLLLMAAPGGEAQLRTHAESVAGLRSEWLDREGIRALHPWVRPDGDGAVFLPDDGQIDISALMAGFAKGARERGVEVWQGTPVDRLMSSHGRVHGVHLGDGRHLNALHVVIAAGGWAAELGARAGSRVRLRVTRRHLMVTRPSPDVRRDWPVVWQLGAAPFYARPESGGMLLCACDIDDVDPDDYERSELVREAIAHRAARYLPDLLEVGAGQYWCGLRTLSADGRFVVGADADVEGLHWAAGLAGAGMVCSAEVGRIAAATLLGGDVAAEEREAWSPGRSCLFASRTDPAA